SGGYLAHNHMLAARETGRTHDLLLAADRLSALPDHAQLHLKHREAGAARASDNRRVRNRSLQALAGAFRLWCPVDDLEGRAHPESIGPRTPLRHASSVLP